MRVLYMWGIVWAITHIVFIVHSRHLFKHTSLLYYQILITTPNLMPTFTIQSTVSWRQRWSMCLLWVIVYVSYSSHMYTCIHIIGSQYMYTSSTFFHSQFIFIHQNLITTLGFMPTFTIQSAVSWRQSWWSTVGMSVSYSSHVHIRIGSQYTSSTFFTLNSMCFTFTLP